jgi:hypothetical protein
VNDGWASALATLIARPDVRIAYGLLLISHTQGVGKTTLADKILVPLVGRDNCSFPTPKMAIDSQFTSWLAFKRLAVVAEIYDGHTSKAYNQLKSFITDDHVEVNEKYEKTYAISNHIHIVASSNSFRALKVDDQDRRWFIPGVAEDKRDHSYWTGLNAWLQQDDALPAVAAWAQDFVDQHGPVLPGQHAPMSHAKRRTIEEGRSDGERLIYELGQAVLGAEGKVVLRRDQVREWLVGRKVSLGSYGLDGKRMLETPERIASVLRSCGLKLPGRQFKNNTERFRIVSNFDVADDCTWEDLKRLARKPDDFTPM